ncbi:MAG: N-acetylmuramoyl-L-alanine amidase family protein [Kiritimatiellia bacterium]|jgi:N-acetylmuramoyl-L-alanine amidase
MKSPFGKLVAVLLASWAAVAAASPEAAADFVEFESELRKAGFTGFVPLEDGLCLTNGEQAVRFHLGSRKVESDGAIVWLHTAPVLPHKATNGWMVLQEDLHSVLLPMFAPTQGPPASLFVMLDPGHGGEDGGAISYNGSIVEKDFTLDMAFRVGTFLEEEGVRVAYTREDDTFVSLSDRPALAAATNANLFVSLHANKASNPAAAGPETYVLPCAGQPSTGGGTLSARARSGNAHDALNNLLAFQIHRRLPGRPRGRDRGVRRSRYQVLREANCPAVLVECGFLSNVGDVARLSSEWYRNRLASAIAAGIVEYSRRLPPAEEPAEELAEELPPADELPEEPVPVPEQEDGCSLETGTVAVASDSPPPASGATPEGTESTVECPVPPPPPDECATKPEPESSEPPPDSPAEPEPEPEPADSAASEEPALEEPAADAPPETEP